MPSDDLDSRIAAVLADTRALPPTERFHAATELVLGLRKHADEAARIRAEALDELRDGGRVSIAEVARVVGITKSRAQDILRKAE